MPVPPIIEAMQKIVILLFATGILLLNGCYYDNEEDLYPNSFCDTANVTYTASILPIIQANCATPGCHVSGGSGNGNFTVFADVSAKVSDGRFLSTVRREAGVLAMPPDGPLRACDVTKIEIWIANGAPNN